jgi:hypothetical protein
MLNLFLEELPLISPGSVPGDMVAGAGLGMLMGWVFALGIVFLLFFLLILVGLWIYTSLAFVAIGKRAKLKSVSPNLAWIPFVGPAIVSNRIAKMHWWPFLLLIGCIIPFVNWMFMIAFTVFFTIWMWKTFEAVKRPGWWAIFALIPILQIVYIVLIGVAAWAKK